MTNILDKAHTYEPITFERWNMGRITMQDIADRANISRRSVSGILNNNPSIKVSEKTRERVLKIAKDLNYQPHHFARSLKTGRTNIIGITTLGGASGWFDNHYAGMVYRGITDYFQGRNYKLIFHNYQRDLGPDQFLELVQNRMVDGIIFFLISMHLDRWAQLLPMVEEIGIPYVVVQSSTQDVGGPCVTLDSFKVGQLATEHLTGHGYKSIGCVTHPRQWPHFADQLDGYKKGLQDKGLTLDLDRILGAESISYDGGYKAAEQILADPGLRRVRAWFVCDELIALGMIKKFNQVGHRVPEDVAIVSFGDASQEGLLLTELTTVRQLSQEKGAQAGEMLLRIIQEDKRPVKQLVKLEPTLLIQKSCGCDKTIEDEINRVST